VLFGTTEAFLEKMGLYSLDDLPALGEFVPDARVVEALEAGLRPDPLPEVVEAQAAVDPTLAPSSSAPTVSASDGVPPEASSDDAGPVDPGAGPRADA
jgi:segregation and condensation protein B